MANERRDSNVRDQQNNRDRDQDRAHVPGRESDKSSQRQEREQGQQSPKPENARGDIGSKRPREDR